jgi:hypothetical protein
MMTATLKTSCLFLTVLFLGLFAMAARNVTDPDLWWHLRTGQLIAEQRRIPHTDPFSYTRAGQAWVTHEWLSEILLYELQRFGGWGGLIVVFAAILSATFFLMYLRCGPHPYIAGVATLCGACATIPVWGVRPQVISLLLTSLWLLILERSEASPKILWWTPPLMLLWVNLHAGFAVGLIFSALFLAGERIESVLDCSLQTKPHMRISTIILLLDLLIVPLNPNGLRLFLYPIETLRSAAMQSYIAEWASPNFHHAEYLPFLLIVLAAFATTSVSRRQLRPRDVILMLVSLYAGLVSIRLMPLFVLVAVPVIAEQFGKDRPEIASDWQPSPARLRGRGLLNSAILTAMVIFAFTHVAYVIRRQAQAEMRHFPLGAVTFLQANPPTGAIFNHYDWGGYLIWKLYPSSRIFIDGRADLYGEPLLHQFADAYQLKNGWRQTLQRWQIATVLVPANSALATGLREFPGWTVSYEDSQAVVFNSSTRQ